MLHQPYHKLHSISYIRSLRNFLFVVSLILIFFIIPAHALAAVNTNSMNGMGSPRTMVPTKNMNIVTRILEVDDPIYTPLEVTLDVISVLFMLIAIFTIITSLRGYGKSTIGIALRYFLNATLVLGAIRLIFILDDDNIYHVHDITEMTAWHFLFVYALIFFYMAGRTFAKLVNSNSGKSSYNIAFSLQIFSVLISAATIISMPYADSFLVQYLQNTWFATFGWFHIIAIVFSLIIFVYLYQLKHKFKGYSGVIGDIYISLALLALIHLWELLNESWKVIMVSDNFGEFLERILWIPVFIFILYSFMKLKKMTTVQPVVADDIQDSTKTTNFQETDKIDIPGLPSVPDQKISGDIPQ